MHALVEQGRGGKQKTPESGNAVYSSSIIKLVSGCSCGSLVVFVFSLLFFPPPFSLTCSCPVCVSVGVAAAAAAAGWCSSSSSRVVHPLALSTWSRHHFSARSLRPIRNFQHHSALISAHLHTWVPQHRLHSTLLPCLPACNPRHHVHITLQHCLLNEYL